MKVFFKPLYKNASLPYIKTYFKSWINYAKILRTNTMKFIMPYSTII